MDDVILMAPTRWRLRQAIKRSKQIFEKLKVQEHPDKTSVGPAHKGFSLQASAFEIATRIKRYRGAVSIAEQYVSAK